MIDVLTRHCRSRRESEFLCAGKWPKQRKGLFCGFYKAFSHSLEALPSSEGEGGRSAGVQLDVLNIQAAESSCYYGSL